MSAQPEHVQRLLRDVSNKQLNLLAIKEEMEQQQTSVETDLEIAKEHFDKLKFNFVELTTKKLFMTKLQTLQLGETPTSAVNEEEVKEEKKKSKALKTTNATLRRQVEAGIQANVEQYQSLQDRLSLAQVALASLEATQKAHAEVMAHYEAQQQDTAGLASVEELEAQLKETTAQLQQLEQQEAAAQAAAASAEQQHEKLTATLSRLNQEHDAVKATLAETMARQDAAAQGSAEWRKAMLTVMEQACRVAIQSQTPECIDLTVWVCEDKKHHVSLIFDPASARLQRVLVDGSETLVKNVVAAAVKANDAPAAVAAVKAWLAER